MESRLNPNAAEFVPSPTASKPSMEEMLSFSPHKGGVAMDDVCMPSPHEFQEEVCLRPSELDNTTSAVCEMSENVLPDLLNGKTELNSNEQNPYQILENVSDVTELLEPVNPFKSSDHLFDKSEVSSTKAEFGDETAASFLANMSGGDFLLNSADTNISGSIDLNASMTEADFVAANLPQEVSGEELTKPQNTFASALDAFEQNVCFELENEFVPSVQSEGYQIPVFTDNENVNSTPLNQELGAVDFTLPASVEFTPVVANPFQENVADVVLETNVEFTPVAANPFQEIVADVVLETQDMLFSNCALSPDKDVSGLISDFTKDLVAPTLSPVPCFDVQVSSISSGIQYIDLGSNISNPVQLENEPISPVQVEPVTPEVKDAVNVVEQNVVEDVVNVLEQNVVEDVELEVQTSNLPSETPVMEEVLSSQDNAGQSESIKEVIEPQPEEPKEESQQPEGVPKSDDSNLLSGIAGQPEAVVVAASVITAAVVGTALAGSENTETKESTKRPIADKAKSSTKATPGNKIGVTPQKSQPKTPTSPSKPLTPMSRTAPVPKKTATTTTSTTTRPTSKPTTTTSTTRVTAPGKSAPSSSITSKVTATSTSQVRVKVASSPTKATPPVKAAPAKTAALTKPRAMPPATTKAPMAEKKPGVANGDVKPLTKRPETLATKKLVSSTTTKPLSRPATAPITSKSTTRTVTSARTAPVSTAASKPTTKPAVNGVAKPKSTTTTTTVRAKPLSAAAKTGTLDKQVKDSANKQISSTGTKSSTVSRTATANTTRRSVGGITKTTTTTTVTKSVPGKKPSATTVTKTSELITVAPSEVVVEEFTTTVTKDDSPIIDNAQIEEISSTD